MIFRWLPLGSVALLFFIHNTTVLSLLFAGAPPTSLRTGRVHGRNARAGRPEALGIIPAMYRYCTSTRVSCQVCHSRTENVRQCPSSGARENSAREATSSALHEFAAHLIINAIINATMTMRA